MLFPVILFAVQQVVLLDYAYFRDYYKMIAIDLSKQQA